MPAVPKPSRARRGFKRPAPRESVPLEITEQQTVIEWLLAHRIKFNASAVDRRTALLYGYQKGHPDIIVYDRPAMVENGLVHTGAAIEMKRRKGGVLAPEQEEWLRDLEERGWKTCVAYGCDEAIKFLEECGYGQRS